MNLGTSNVVAVFWIMPFLPSLCVIYNWGELLSINTPCNTPSAAGQIRRRHRHLTSSLRTWKWRCFPSLGFNAMLLWFANLAPHKSEASHQEQQNRNRLALHVDLPTNRTKDISKKVGNGCHGSGKRFISANWSRGKKNCRTQDWRNLRNFSERSRIDCTVQSPTNYSIDVICFLLATFFATPLRSLSGALKLHWGICQIWQGMFQIKNKSSSQFHFFGVVPCTGLVPKHVECRRNWWISHPVKSFVRHPLALAGQILHWHSGTLARVSSKPSILILQQN